MKNRSILALMLLLSTLIFACKKFDPQPASNSYYLRAQKNNVAWEATQGAYIVSGSKQDTLTFFGSKDEEHLNIITYINSSNQLKLDSAKTKFYTTVGTDAVASSYRLDTVSSNKTTINIINLNQPISGNFNLTFKKVSGDNSFPDKIILSDGAFLLPRAVIY